MTDTTNTDPASDPPAFAVATNVEMVERAAEALDLVVDELDLQLPRPENEPRTAALSFLIAAAALVESCNIRFSPNLCHAISGFLESMDADRRRGGITVLMNKVPTVRPVAGTVTVEQLFGSLDSKEEIFETTLCLETAEETDNGGD